jgi:hypothetical protein
MSPAALIGDRALKALRAAVCPVPPFAILRAVPRVKVEIEAAFEPTIGP